MTFLRFQKELYYISEGIIHKNSQKDLRRCEGFQKVLYSAEKVLDSFLGASMPSLFEKLNAHFKIFHI